MSAVIGACTCTCGNVKPHVIARRSTADGKHVCLWDDGQLTWALGYHIRGAMNPRTPEQQVAARKVGRLVLGDVELYAAAEVSELISAARWAAERDGIPGTMRARLYAQRRKAQLAAMLLAPKWEVLQADRDGKPTSRVWRLHRMSPWAGCVVFDERRSCGRYHLAARVRANPYGTTRATDDAYEELFHFDTLDALLTWMVENPPRSTLTWNGADSGAVQP